MSRTMLAVAAALFFAAPATAQTRETLSRASWSCWMTSLVGDPGGNLVLNFEQDAGLFASFYIEIPQGPDVISVEFDATGSWTISGSVISMQIGAIDLIGAWVNDEELDADMKAGLEEDLGAELASFSGESAIAYIADHAMVLEEPDTSISCWRA